MNQDELVTALLEGSTQPVKQKPKLANIPLAKLHPFDGHPYKVQDDEAMAELTESIRVRGVYTPLAVRSKDGMENEYEVISGHRRLHAAQKAGLKTVPAFIYALDRDATAIAVVDSNLHREHILPSEKAFAYKLKMDALSHQGKTASAQVAPKLTTEAIGEAESVSKDTVKRYIRLTNLIPELMQLVDDGKIAFTPAVELSYLTGEEQRGLLEAMQSEDCTPSLSQAQQLKKLSQEGTLAGDTVFRLLSQPKANQKEKLSLPVDDLRRYFPKDYSAQQMQAAILKLVRESYERKQRQRGDAR